MPGEDGYDLGCLLLRVEREAEGASFTFAYFHRVLFFCVPVCHIKEHIYIVGLGLVREESGDFHEGPVELKRSHLLETVHLVAARLDCIIGVYQPLYQPPPILAAVRNENGGNPLVRYRGAG